jgi:lipoate synthase
MRRVNTVCETDRCYKLNSISTFRVYIAVGKKCMRACVFYFYEVKLFIPASLNTLEDG